MALKPCRECEREVSTGAEQCPHCGVKHPANRSALIGESLTKIGCILTLIITTPVLFVVCFGLASV